MSEADQAGAKPNGCRPAAQTFASIVGWVWGSLSLLTGILMLAVGPGATQRVFGASAICAGLLLLPLVVGVIRRRIPFMRTPGFPTLAAVLVGAIILMAMPWPKPSVEPSSNSPAPASAPPVKTDRGPSRAERREAEKRTRITTEINAMWSELTSITQTCDQAATAASDSLGRSGSRPHIAYTSVETAKRTCADVGVQIRRIDVPRSLEKDERKAFNDALNNCGWAYAGKSVMFDRMLKVVDGDRRPSQLARVQEAGRTSQAQVVQCVLTITALAHEQGVEIGGEP